MKIKYIRKQACYCLFSILGLSTSTIVMPFVNSACTFVSRHGNVSYADLIKETKWGLSSATGLQDPITYSETDPNYNKAYVTIPITNITGATDAYSRYSYVDSVLDDPNHMVLDNSINEDCYRGVLSWINNDDQYATKKLTNPGAQKVLPTDTQIDVSKVYKPKDATNVSFTDAYATAAKFANCKVLSTCGFLHEVPIQSLVSGDPLTSRDSNHRTIFKNKIFNDVGFLLNDGSIDNLENVVSIMYRSDQAAFLAGIAACYYLDNNYDIFKSNGLKIGVFGGEVLSTVTSYMGGIERGVEFYNYFLLPYWLENNITNYNNLSDQEKEKIINNYEIKFVDLGVLSSYFTNSFSAGDGKGLVKLLLALHADVIFPVDAPQAKDCTDVISSRNGSTVVIGVDSEMENTDAQQTSNGKKIIIYSATKNMHSMTKQVLNIISSGRATNIDELKDKTDLNALVGGLGYHISSNLENNGVQISKPGFDYLEQAFIPLFNANNLTWDKTTEDAKQYDTEFADFITVLMKLNLSFPTFSQTGINRIATDSTSGQKTSIIAWLENNMYFSY